MNSTRITTIASTVLLVCSTFAQAQEMDSQITQLTEILAAKMAEHANKKITVLDFTDLQGGASELGRYIAEQITVDLVMKKREFTVMDRSNLKSILDEHKLTTSGLVNPENAKKLGMFAGVDALVLGRVVPLGQRFAVTGEIISTETAEIIGGAKAEFKADETTRQLASKPTAETTTNTSTQPQEDKPKAIKTFGDWRVEVESLRVVNGMNYVLNLNVTNLNPQKTIYVALECEGPVAGALKSEVDDPEGYKFISDGSHVNGISVGSWTFMGYGGAVKKIVPHDSVSATVEFVSDPSRQAGPGRCHIQLGFLDVALDGYGKVTRVSTRNFMCDLSTEATAGAQ